MREPLLPREGIANCAHPAFCRVCGWDVDGARGGSIFAKRAVIEHHLPTAAAGFGKQDNSISIVFRGVQIAGWISSLDARSKVILRNPYRGNKGCPIDGEPGNGNVFTPT
jgi:hypothetical protein